MPFLSPAKNPKKIPITASKIIAIKASLIVTGKALAITSVTSLPEKVFPKSRVTIPFRYSRYCIHSGLSRLYSARICAATEGGNPLSPPSACTGSPGMAYTMAKISNVAPKNTGIICSRRCPMYLSIGLSLTISCVKPYRVKASRKNRRRVKRHFATFRPASEPAFIAGLLFLAIFRRS